MTLRFGFITLYSPFLSGWLETSSHIPVHITGKLYTYFARETARLDLGFLRFSFLWLIRLSRHSTDAEGWKMLERADSRDC